MRLAGLVGVVAVGVILVVSAVAQSPAPPNARDIYNQASQLYVDGKKAEALLLFEKAGAAGDANAMISAGDMHLVGDSVPEDNARAAGWFGKAMAAGNAKGTLRVGRMYAKGPDWPGNPYPKDPTKALELYVQAFDAGNTGAGLYAGGAYDKGEGAQPDMEKALFYYKVAARYGNPTAAYNLGILYWNGKKVEENEGAAFVWWMWAAQLGDKDAPGQLAELTRPFKVSKASFAERERLWKAAYAAENSGLKGEARSAAQKKAFELYREAAELGEATGIHETIRSYEAGVGVEKDESAAIVWTRIGAEMDIRDHMIWLGKRMMTGDGVPKDLMGARFWLEKAALKANSGVAKITLARLYEGQFDFPPNKALAVYWYKQAAADKEPAARQWLEDNGYNKPDPVAAAFIEKIEREGPRQTNASDFMLDVAQYCSYGGKKCHELNIGANKFLAAQNSRMSQAEMQRIWNLGNTSAADEAERRAKSECTRRTTQSLQRYTYGEQDWYFQSEC